MVFRNMGYVTLSYTHMVDHVHQRSSRSIPAPPSLLLIMLSFSPVPKHPPCPVCVLTYQDKLVPSSFSIDLSVLACFLPYHSRSSIRSSLLYLRPRHITKEKWWRRCWYVFSCFLYRGSYQHFKFLFYFISWFPVDPSRVRDYLTTTTDETTAILISPFIQQYIEHGSTRIITTKTSWLLYCWYDDIIVIILLLHSISLLRIIQIASFCWQWCCYRW